MPVRSPAPWLGEALQSIRRQTFRDFGLIAVLDGDAPDILQQFVSMSRAKIEIAEPSLGVGYLRNRGLSLASSQLVACIDSDDIWSADHLEVQTRYFQENRDVVLVGASSHLVDESGLVLQTRRAKPGPQERLLLWRNTILNSSAVFSLEDAMAVDGYREGMRIGEDYDLWLRLGMRGTILNSRHTSVSYRVHQAQTSRSQFGRDDFQSIRHSRRCLAAHLGIPTSVAEVAHTSWVARQWISGRASRAGWRLG